MKLSELSTGRAADVLLQVASMAGTITGDKELMGTIGQAIDIKEKNLNQRGVLAEYIKQWCEFISILLENHRKNLFGILAVVNGVGVEDIEAQLITDTFRQLEEIRDDEVLVRFLSSFTRQGQNAQYAPSLTVLPASPQGE